MNHQEKQFILNKGLILGLILMMFPIVDLIYGLKMSNTNYFLVFGLLWLLVFTFLILKWSKEFASYYELFSFRDAFRTLFLISGLAFGILTVGKTLLWTFSFPEKYIEINEKREIGYFNLQQTLIDNSYKSGTFSDDQYESQLGALDDSKKILEEKWSSIRSEGIGNTYFIQVLVSVLFINSIYCSILALFVRKKNKIY